MPIHLRVCFAARSNRLCRSCERPLHQFPEPSLPKCLRKYDHHRHNLRTGNPKWAKRVHRNPDDQSPRLLGLLETGSRGPRLQSDFQWTGPQFERATGHKVVVKFGLAAVFKQQIEAGEPFDVAILTPPLIDDLYPLLVPATCRLPFRGSRRAPMRSSTSANSIDSFATDLETPLLVRNRGPLLSHLGQLDVGRLQISVNDSFLVSRL
jgi:hypothetical protein